MPRFTRSPERAPLANTLGVCMQPDSGNGADSQAMHLAQGFADRKGNCLSFTLTFLELARLAGLDAEMQESENAIVSMPGEGDLV